MQYLREREKKLRERRKMKVWRKKTGVTIEVHALGGKGNKDLDENQPNQKNTRAKINQTI